MAHAPGIHNGRHRVWGDIEVSSASSSSSNNAAEDKHGYSAKQIKESVRYLRDRKIRGQGPDGDAGQVQAPVSWLDGQFGGQQAAVFEGQQSAIEASRGVLPNRSGRVVLHQSTRVFEDKSRKGFASTNDSDCWDVDGELKGMPAAHGVVPPAATGPGWEGSTSNLPSAGSAAHAVGTCRPCHYEHSKVGCEKGASCGFCHYKHPKHRRSRLAKDRSRGEGYEVGYASDEGRGVSSPARLTHMLISL